MYIVWNITIDVGIVIAIFALGVSIWQMIETRRHNKTTLRPFLNSHYTFENEGKLVMCELKNVGLGLAYVTKFQIVFRDEVIEPISYEETNKFFETKLKESGASLNAKFKASGFNLGAIIDPGSSHVMFKIEANEGDKEAFLRWKNVLFEFSYKIKYRSIYKDDFTFPDKDS